MTATFRIGEKEYSEIELKALEKAGVLHIGTEYRQKHDPASTTLTAPTLHGPFPGNANQFGLFSGAGVRPERHSALARPRTLARLLQPTPSEYTNELLEIMTGQTASTGTNATGFCGNPPTVGQLKVCRQQFIWGSYSVKTDLNAVPLIGQLRDRADVPANILHASPAANPLIPDMMYRLDQTRSQLQYELFRIGVSTERSLETVLIQGNTALNSTQSQHGWIAEFAGLDGQIATGHTDQPTGVACPAADSAIVNFNADVAGTIAGGDGRNVVQAAHDLVWALKDRGAQVGMEGVEYAIIMRGEQFRAVVEQWACQYATYRCSGSAGNPFNTNTNDTNALRLEMLGGEYLLIDGMAIPVVFSDGIPREVLANNTYMADMYVVPISWNGMQLLRFEYFNMANPYATEYRQFVSPDDKTVLNNGLYLAAKRTTGFCDEYLFAARMRLILETPFLAGRLDNVQFVFQAPIRDAIPGLSFYADGGLTY